MELFFLAVLILLMAAALASGFPVAFALPGSAILTIALAAICGLIFTGESDSFFAHDGPLQWLSAGVTNFRGVYWETERDTLIAIPLFVFMGIMLQRSKIAEDLLVSMAQLFGPIRGGLGISVVFVGALLAATTGILGATVVAMGLISLPAMLRNNYSQSLATGTICASGTLGQIIPPSIVLIILADQLASAADQAGATRKVEYKEATGNFTMPSEFDIVSTSAGDMFLGAFLPGLVLVGLYMFYILVFAFLKPNSAPAVPYHGEYDRRFALRVLLALVPPLALIFLVLGSIIAGIATVNQAGAIGAAGAMVMAGYRLYDGRRGAFYPAILCIASLVGIFALISNYDLNIKAISSEEDKIGVALALIAVTGLMTGLIWSCWRTYKIDSTLLGVMVETAKTTSLVFIILLGAAMLTAAFRAFGGEEVVRDFLGSLPGGFWSQFVVVMAVIFLLGFFLDFIEIAVVVVPIVAPILLADPTANITAVWLGVMIGVNIQTSFLTPPFGFALFYLRGVAPSYVKTIEIYRGVVVFIGLQLIGLAIVGTFPGLVNYLPNRASLTSETAPPPLNPKLQACIEEYLLPKILEREADLKADVEKLRAVDMSAMPKKVRSTIDKALKNALATTSRIEAMRKADAAQAEAEVAYKPLHGTVRLLQRNIRRLQDDIKSESTSLNRLKRDADNHLDRIAAIEAFVLDAEQQIAAFEAQIPETYQAARKEFQVVQKAATVATAKYRRGVDDAYKPLPDLITTIESGAPLAALRGELETLRDLIVKGATQEDEPAFKEVERLFNDIAQSSKIRSAVSQARRDATGTNQKPEKAMKSIETALKVLDEEATWRTAAEASVLPALKAYEASIRDTIGLRQQPRMSHELSLHVASCKSEHRDISLYF